MRKKIMAALAVSSIFGCLWSAQALANAQSMGLYTVTNITSNDDLNDKYPVINLDSTITWMGQEPGAIEDDYEIFVYTPTTGIVQVTHNSFDDSYPEINSNGEIVWMARGEYDPTGAIVASADWEVWHYNLNTDSFTVMTTNDVDDQYPQISQNGNIAWNTFDGNDWEISYYNAATGDNGLLTDNDYGDYLSSYSSKYNWLYKSVSFRMNSQGEIVWMGSGDIDAQGQFIASDDLEIWHYDPASGIIAQITNNDVNDWSPQINAVGDMVWEEYDGTDYEIGYFSHASGTVKILSDNAFSDYYPQLNNSGDVAWMSHDGNDWEIAYFEATSGVSRLLTDNEFDDMNQTINNRGDIAWTTFETSPGEQAQFVLNLYDKTIGDFYEITSFMTHFDSYPQLNDNSEITWFGSEWNGWEVYYAKPNPLSATVVIKPGKINLNGNKKRIKAVISLPEMFDCADIDLETVLISEINGVTVDDDEIEVEGRAKVADFDGDGVTELRVRFETEDLLEMLMPGVAELTITGNLTDGTPFTGSATILVKGKKHDSDEDDDKDDDREHHKKEKKKKHDKDD